MSDAHKPATTGLDIEGGTIAPERVDWSVVKRLAVLDMLNADDRPVLFAPIVVWADDTWARLTETLDIETARKTCARLSALHDTPVQDWTRPAPVTLSDEGFLLEAERRGFRADEVPPDESVAWACGWGAADRLFEQGASDADFLASLTATRERVKAKARRMIGADAHIVESTLAVHEDEARHRWAVLNAANSREAV